MTLMTDALACDRYRIALDEPARPKRWFRGLGVIIANIALWIDGFGTGPTNPGGRTIKVIDNSTGCVVLEFVEEFGDDARLSLAMLEKDIESLTAEDFESRWL